MGTLKQHFVHFFVLLFSSAFMLLLVTFLVTRIQRFSPNTPPPDTVAAEKTNAAEAKAGILQARVIALEAETKAQDDYRQAQAALLQKEKEETEVLRKSPQKLARGLTTGGKRTAAVFMDTKGLTCDQMAPTRCSGPIRKGETSLLDGMVLSLDLAIYLTETASHAQDRVTLEIHRLERMQAIDLQLQKATAESTLKACKGDVDAEHGKGLYYQRRAETAEAELSPPFYATKGAFFTYGVVATTVIVAALAVEMHAIPSL